MSQRHFRLALVASVIARHDAISACVKDTYAGLVSEPGFKVAALTLRNDYPELPAHVVSGVGDLLLNQDFLAADVLLYHFGVYSPLLDALVTATHARQIVRFHNITPLEYVPSDQRKIIADSFRQIHNLKYADELWADSPINAEELIANGIPKERIYVIPLAVGTPAQATLGSKANKPLTILFVGRAVPAKGLLDLIEAAAILRRKSQASFRVEIVSNMEWSDSSYTAKLMKFVTEHGLSEVVNFRGAVDDATLERLYHNAHVLAIPSYHEGFCKPVVEALRAGCVVVGYESYNLPIVVNNLGRLVPPGNVEALASVLVEVLEGIQQAVNRPHEPLLPLDRGPTSVAAFDDLAGRHTMNFTFERFQSSILSRIRGANLGTRDEFREELRSGANGVAAPRHDS